MPQVKVTETIERWCCEPKDLKRCQLEKGGSKQVVYVCQHCSQLWVEEQYTDAAGWRDTKLCKVSRVQ